MFIFGPSVNENIPFESSDKLGILLKNYINSNFKKNEKEKIKQIESKFKGRMRIAKSYK